jgi:prephenate dehydrogenase
MDERTARKSSMRIGILGSGLMGGKLGTIFARAGHDVVFSYARSNEKLKKPAREAQGKARAGTPAEAAKEAEALLLAVHWSRIDDVLMQTGDLTSPGEKHWHGATPTTAMTHIAIHEKLDGKVVEWMEQVSDEQYRK